MASFAGVVKGSEFMQLFNLNKYYMGIFLIFILFTLIFACCGILCGFIINCRIIWTICRIPVGCCTCIFLILILLYSGILLAIYKLGGQLIDATCGEDTGNSIISKDTMSGFYTFVDTIYDDMDEFYCTDVCACEVESDTFADADAE